MRRFIIPITVALAAVTTGCLYEREAVRDDRRVENPPPPAPPDYSPAAPDPGYQSYQSEAPPPPAGSEVSSEAVFYERLSPYGYWTFVAPYGRIWVPAVGWGWRPYYYGRWVLTDWGWTFASDDPWGWAAYHYGRWNWGVGLGWYWIPGTVWAPAWVSWRYGAGYVGWCPLGPSGVVFGYRHPAWVAVSQQHFTRPIAAVAVPSQRTYAVVTQARPLTGPHATVGRGGSFGPPVADVARATGQQIRPVAAAQVVRPRPTTAISNPREGVMRSPVQPRARTGAARPVPTARPGERTRAAPARPSAPPSGSAPSGPRAAPPSGAGSAPSAPRAAPPSGGGGEHGGGHGGGPHATSGRSQAR